MNLHAFNRRDPQILFRPERPQPMPAISRAEKARRVAAAAAALAELERERAREAAHRLTWPKIRDAFRGSADFYPAFVLRFESAGFRTRDFSEEDLGALTCVAELLALVQTRLRSAGRRDDRIAVLRRRIDHTLYIRRDRFTQETSIVAAPSGHAGSRL